MRTYILGCCVCYHVMPEIVQFMIGLLKCFCFGPNAGALVQYVARQHWYTFASVEGATCASVLVQDAPVVILEMIGSLVWFH